MANAGSRLINVPKAAVVNRRSASNSRLNGTIGSRMATPRPASRSSGVNFGSTPAPKAMVVTKAATGAVGYALLAVPHLPRLPVIGAAVLISIYISLAYVALPSLIIREVEADETGVATSLNAIARTLGASLAAALVAVLLSRTHHGYEPAINYSIIFGMGAVTACAAILLIVLSGRSRTRDGHAECDDNAAKSSGMNHEWG